MPLLQELLPDIVKRGVKITFAYIVHRIAHPPPTEPDYFERYRPDTEITIVQSHIMNARLLLQSGDRARAQMELNQAIGISHCDRCKRALEQILEGNNAAMKLDTLHDLVPTYYKVMREEEAGKLKSIVTKHAGTGMEDEKCEACLADKIVDLCGKLGTPKINQECLDYAVELSKQYPDASEDTIIRKVEEFVSAKKKEIGVIG